MNDRALLYIVSVLDCYPERPYDRSFPDSLKEEITYSRWALNELLDLVWDHPFVPASETIEGYAIVFQIYAEASVLPDQKRIFDIAADTAIELLKEIKEVEK